MSNVTSADPAPGPGVDIGAYRIVRLIGRGGMGVVYEARHTRVGQRAALKLLDPERRRAVGPGAVRRFMTEVDALARLEHPGLVRVLDCGDDPAHGPWIAMELVAGEGLRARLERGPVALPAALRTARRIASAVAAIHGAGIVHRDLKPDNVMVVPDDEVPGRERVKLLDFGIAKLTDGGGVQTTAGTVLGTAGYMAPEQCTGLGDIDDRADVYALGVILFELVAGRRPFTGPALDVMRQHLHDEPPFERLADAPAAAVALVRAMLAKEPSRRPAIGAVVDRLRAIEETIAGAPEAEPVVTRPIAAPASGTAATEEAAATATTAAAREPAAAAHAPAAAARGPAVVRRGRRRTIAIAAAMAAVALGALVAIGAARRGGERPRGPAALPGMVVIAGARFQMGSTRAEVDAACRDLPGGCLDAERPILERELSERMVTVSTFQLDALEVTYEQYAQYLSAHVKLVDVRDDADDHYPRFVFDRASGAVLLDLYPKGASPILQSPDGMFRARPEVAALPVAQVTWDGASRYCLARGKRLPTEAEWELAARGPERRRFPWGKAAPRCEGVVFGRGDPRGCADRPARVEPVGTAAQDVTPDGVRDLGGNVGEWVQDQFVVPYDGDCGACKDPVVDRRTMEEDTRVFRGGTYWGIAWVSRTTTRGRWIRTQVMDGLGFRCATR